MTVLPREEEADVDFISGYKRIKEEILAPLSLLFLLLPSVRKRGNRHKIEHWSFPLKIRQHFYALQVPEHCCRLLRGCGVSSLELLRGYLTPAVGVPAEVKSWAS